MASPTVAAQNKGGNTGSATHTINLPAGINAADQLIVVFLGINQSRTLDTIPAGWTQVGTPESAGSHSSTAIYYYTDGTEGYTGDGTDTISVTWSASNSGEHVSVRVSGAEDPATTAIAFAYASQGPGTSQDYNFPQVSPTASRDHLYLGGLIGDSTVVISTPPTNYTLTDTQAGGGASAAVSVIDRELTAQNEDPAVVTSGLSKADQFYIIFMAIAPAAAGTTTPQAVAATSTMTPALSRSITYVQTVAAAVTLTAVLARVVDYFRSLSVGSPMTPTLARTAEFLRSLSVSSTLTPVVSRTVDYFRNLSVTSSMTAALARANLFQVAVDATSTIVAGLSKLSVQGVTIAATTTMTAAMTRLSTFARSLAVASPMAVVVTKTASFFRTLAATSAVNSALVEGAIFLRTLATTVSNAASLITNFIPGTPADPADHLWHRAMGVVGKLFRTRGK